MSLEDFKDYIKNKTFMDQNDTIYRFISETTLRIGNSMSDSVNYKIYEEDDIFYFDHSKRFGTEDLLITIQSENPLQITLLSKSNKRYFFILKEQR